MRILVVEDEKKIALFVQKGLKELGFVVDVLHQGDEAMDVILTHHFDAIVLDVMLPGQDGLSLTRQLKADPLMASIRVVAVTAHAMVGDRQLSLDAGCIGHITKPFDTKAITEQIAGFLQASA